AMREQQAAQAQAAARWAEAVEQARKRYEDFDEVVSVNVPIPQAAFTAILDSPVGPDIAYYLGKNPDVVRKLNSMVNNPAAVYREIGKLEALLERSNPGTSAKTTPKPKPKPTATPVSKAGTAPLASRKSPDEMTYQEYKAWREEQIAKKRGLR
ncbi:MAG TPA: hypothetical protein PKV43_13140, partial [Armatimonadota bacterium]|nr:hypothetical protein [Armatimonadota bacterium]